MQINTKTAQNIINRYGTSKSYNQVGLAVNCVNDNGESFTVLQFNDNTAIITDFKSGLQIG